MRYSAKPAYAAVGVDSGVSGVLALGFVAGGVVDLAGAVLVRAGAGRAGADEATGAAAGFDSAFVSALALLLALRLAFFSALAVFFAALAATFFAFFWTCLAGLAFFFSSFSISFANFLASFAADFSMDFFIFLVAALASLSLASIELTMSEVSDFLIAFLVLVAMNSVNKKIYKEIRNFWDNQKVNVKFLLHFL